MALPSQLDAQIRSRFESLIERANRFLALYANKSAIFSFEGEDRVQFEELKTNFLTIIELLFGRNERGKELIQRVSTVASTRLGTQSMLGLLRALKNDYEAGLLQNLSQIIGAEIAADYMGQAEQLLGEGVSGQFDHVPAAVLTGAVLEDSLRKLCQRQMPTISIAKPNGDPKTMGTLIDDLKASGLYNELKAKQLRAWADIRNAAAHGEFTKFKRQDVENMISSVNSFLADYL